MASIREDLEADDALRQSTALLQVGSYAKRGLRHCKTLQPSIFAAIQLSVLVSLYGTRFSRSQ